MIHKARILRRRLIHMKRTRPYRSLKAWRAAQGLSQREAARKLGMSQAGYSRAESGTMRPRVKKAVLISERTGVPLETVLCVA